MPNKSARYAIATLTAAGFLSAGNQIAADDTKPAEKGFWDGVNAIVDNFNKEHTYTLAQHYSHQSHGSHVSHSSHRSYYKPPNIEDDLRIEDDLVDNQNSGIQLATIRNDRSTPANSILPSTPAITKLKVLKGNSAKFAEIISAAKLALMARGYEVSSVDGTLDAKTMAAIYKFQQAHGMSPNGRVTPEVLTALNIAAD